MTEEQRLQAEITRLFICADEERRQVLASIAQSK